MRPARSGGGACTDLRDDLAGTETVVVLDDEHGRVLRRLAADGSARDAPDRTISRLPVMSAVGTNGVGTTLHRRRHVHRSDEHFADVFTPVLCRETDHERCQVGQSVSSQQYVRPTTFPTAARRDPSCGVR
jgi:hypothetical protein